jgi:phosphatidate cytidylyltransferase
MAQYEQASAESISLLGMTVLKSGAPGYLTVENVFLAAALGYAVLAAASRRPVSEALGAVSVSAAALLAVALPLSYLIRVQGAEQGRLWMLFTLCLIWAGDSLAYFVGRAFGRLKMAPQISPGKTWEGAAGNLAGSLVVAGIFSRWLEAPGAALLAVAALANMAGQAGDLLESAYKRSAGVKDSGALLPGHGGVLDRIDALVFAAPVVWLYIAHVW